MPETYGVKYIGSKRNLLPQIGAVIHDLGARNVIDVFSGTTRVAQYLRQHDIRTTTSDLSWATSAYAATFVHNPNNAHLGQHIMEMNRLTGHAGWLTKNYSGEGDPLAERADGRCFQYKNTIRADAAREYVEVLDLEPWEKHTLITSIIMALDRVDNTVGVQQAYLKSWCARSFNDIRFELPTCLSGPAAFHHEGDCLAIDYPGHDLAYLDPPYSPHSYATYYHIWDSIVRWDKPKTGLKARRRVDRVAKSPEFDPAMSSPWNSPRTALDAFDGLVERLPVKNVVVSYSDESIVDRSDLVEVLSRHGDLTTLEIDYKRNIMSQIGNATKNGPAETGQRNTELVFILRKP